MLITVLHANINLYSISLQGYDALLVGTITVQWNITIQTPEMKTPLYNRDCKLSLMYAQ